MLQYVLLNFRWGKQVQQIIHTFIYQLGTQKEAEGKIICVYTN